MSPGAVSDALALVHVELCAYLAFSQARPTARMVVREGLDGRLREAVAEAAAEAHDELDEEARTTLQARVARLWCDVALNLYSPSRVRAWMQQQGYSATEVEHALRDA